MPNLDGESPPSNLSSSVAAVAYTQLLSLTGVSATSMIRQFDSQTPIVSMTSNSGPNDVLTYFSHGTLLHSLESRPLSPRTDIDACVDHQV